LPVGLCQQGYVDHQSLGGWQQLPQRPWYGMEASSWPPPKKIHIAHSFLCYLFNKLLNLTFTLVKTRKVHIETKLGNWAQHEDFVPINGSMQAEERDWLEQ
jgi:hypothetical protein